MKSLTRVELLVILALFCFTIALLLSTKSNYKPCYSGMEDTQKGIKGYWVFVPEGTEIELYDSKR